MTQYSVSHTMVVLRPELGYSLVGHWIVGCPEKQGNFYWDFE